MADRRILRFRRRAPDGSTQPLLSAGQAERISEGLLAGERQAQSKKPGWKRPFHDTPCLAQVEPTRRRAIVAAARRNVNNRATTALVLAVPIALYGTVMWIGEGVIPGAIRTALPIVLFVPAIAVHVMLVRREIEALVARELEGDCAGL